MQKDTAYLNKLVRKKQHERSLEYHYENLKNTKPLTRPLDGFDISINKNKKQYQNQIRFTQIQRQNRILLEKISGIMNKTKRGSSFADHNNRSLNSTFRKKQSQNIQIQNAKMLKRLQQKKPNYETDKLNREWLKQKQVMKIMSNYPFMLADRPKHKRNSTSNMEKQKRFQIMEPIQLYRVRVLDGVNFLITLQLSAKMLRITGDCKDRKQLKVIEIDRNQALQFIEEECQSKLEEVFNHLRYDKEEGVLYLVGNQVELEDLINKEKQHYANSNQDKGNQDLIEQNQLLQQPKDTIKQEQQQNKEESKKEEVKEQVKQETKQHNNEQNNKAENKEQQQKTEEANPQK